MHVSEYFYGTWNDKQITVNDTYPMEVFGGQRFRDLRYVLFTKDGIPITYQGAWLAVDGGYQKAACFINPMHNRFAFPEVVFSEWLESVRKDVECAFGILKIRFRLLRNPVVYQDAETISNAFKTACMLHNMLLEYDGLNEFNWENMDPDDDIVDDADPVIVVEDHDLPEPFLVLVDRAPRPQNYVAYHSYKYDTVRDALKDHFYWKYLRGEVEWPKKFLESQKDTFPLTRIAIYNRINMEHERALYIQASSLRGKDRASGSYYVLIGEGLFSNSDYKVGDHIADYKGELIFNLEADRRVDAGKGGYMIHVSNNTKLDCYDTCRRGECKASKANSSTNVFNSITGTMAINNASIVVSTSVAGGTRVRLQACKKISKHTEIITTYGPTFIYPAQVL